MANKFNKYFINLAQKLLKDLGESNHIDCLKKPNENSFFLKETGRDEIHKLLQKVNIKKGSNIYGYHLK